MTTAKHTLAVDAALVGTVLIWAVNFSVVKLALEELEPFAFNSIRLIGASIIFLTLARLVPAPSILPEDRLRFVALALMGHAGYQLLFISGIDETTASNAAILLGLTPVFVAILSAVFCIERATPRVWFGISVSVLGVYLVLHDSARLGGSTRGDGLTLAATLCWSAYTVLGQPIVARYGLVKTNAYTMALGTLAFFADWPTGASCRRPEHGPRDSVVGDGVLVRVRARGCVLLLVFCGVAHRPHANGDLLEPHAGGRTCDRPSMDRRAYRDASTHRGRHDFSRDLPREKTPVALT